MGARGPLAGTGKSHQRIMDVLRGLGTEKDGRPKAIRAAELAARTQISHRNLSKAIVPLIEQGVITRCRVRMPIGAPTYEYRVAAGATPQPAFVPLNTRRTDAAVATPRDARQVPLRVSATASPAEARDRALLQRIQQMDAAQFGHFVGWLAEVWRWSRQADARGAA